MRRCQIPKIKFPASVFNSPELADIFLHRSAGLECCRVFWECHLKMISSLFRSGTSQASPAGHRSSAYNSRTHSTGFTWWNTSKKYGWKTRRSRRRRRRRRRPVISAPDAVSSSRIAISYRLELKHLNIHRLNRVEMISMGCGVAWQRWVGGQGESPLLYPFIQSNASFVATWPKGEDSNGDGNSVND